MPGGSLWGMHTFETSIRSSSFRLAVLLLPLGFWAVVQMVAAQAGDEPMRAVSLIAIVGLANALSLAALLWMLCSVAGYTVEPGRVIEHRVVRDREIPLDALVEEPRSANGVITLRLRRRTMRLRVTELERCLALLRGNNAEGVRTGARQASTVKRGGTTTPSR